MTMKTEFRLSIRMISCLRFRRRRSIQREQVCRTGVSCEAMMSHDEHLASVGRKFDLRERFAEAQLKGMSCCTCKSVLLTQNTETCGASDFCQLAGAEGPSFSEIQPEV